MAHAIRVAGQVNAAAHAGFSATIRPPTSATMRRTTPIAVASATFPGRKRFIHQPIRNAIGTVQAIVNNPHGLSRSAFVTTSARTASRMIMIAKIATMAAIPATGFTSSLAI